MANIEKEEKKYECKTETYTEPLLLTIATCEQHSIKYKFGSTEFMISKNDLGLIVVLSDMLVVVILIFFVNFLERRQNEYTLMAKDETIEMDDFGVRLSNMPRDKLFGGSFQLFKAQLWSQMTDLMK